MGFERRRPVLDNVSLAGLVLIGGTALVALTERIRKGGLSTVPPLAPDPAPLRHAAEIAYDYAKEWRLPLAAIAERKSRSGDPVTWFENSLLRAVPVSATSNATGTQKVLGSFSRAGMYAVPNGIAKTSGGEAVYSDPTVSAKDFKSYMRWARTVW